MGKSWSQTIMKDQRLVLEEAQIVAAPEAVLTVTQAYPGSVAVAEKATVGDIVVQEYTPEIQKTVGELIESVKLVSQETIPTLVESFSAAMGKTAETSMKVTEVLGEKLQETQVGTASILPGVAKYLLIAAVVIVVAGKVWK